MIFEKKYRTDRGFECLSICISNYMKYLNFNISTSDIFLLGKGYELYYNGFIDNPKISTNIYASNFRFLNKSKISYHYANCVEDQLSNYLDNMVDREEMIILRVGTSFLDYSRAHSSATQAFHCINVIGRKDNDYIISDGVIPTLKATSYQGKISKEKLIEAWCVSGYQYICIESVDIDINKLKKESYKMLEKALKYEIKQNNRPIIKALKDLLKEMDTKRSNTQNIIENIIFQLKTNGFIASKWMIAEKIEELEVEENNILKYKNIISEWYNVLLLLIKASISGEEKSYSNILYKTVIICQQEKNILIDIKEKMHNERRRN